MKRLLRDIPDRCCARRRKVPETVAEVFGLMDELSKGADAADIVRSSKAEPQHLFELVNELRGVCEEG